MLPNDLLVLPLAVDVARIKLYVPECPTSVGVAKSLRHSKECRKSLVYQNNNLLTNHSSINFTCEARRLTLGN